MVKIPSFFSLKHFLVLSLALNVSLVMRVIFENEKQGPLFGFSMLKLRGSSMADRQVRQRTLLSTSYSSSSSSSAKTTLAEVEDDQERIVNLDQ